MLAQCRIKIRDELGPRMEETPLARWRTISRKISAYPQSVVDFLCGAALPRHNDAASFDKLRSAMRTLEILPISRHLLHLT